MHGNYLRGSFVMPLDWSDYTPIEASWGEHLMLQLLIDSHCSISFCRRNDPMPVTNGSRPVGLSHSAAHHPQNLRRQNTLELADAKSNDVL